MKLANDRRKLDRLRPRPEDHKYLHVKTEWKETGRHKDTETRSAEDPEEQMPRLIT
jgi:hypothetical protein